jgi:hypothetical protein
LSEPFVDRLKRRLPEALFEGVFVVFAVLIALGVDEYREGRAEREQAGVLGGEPDSPVAIDPLEAVLRGKNNAP